MLSLKDSFILREEERSCGERRSESRLNAVRAIPRYILGTSKRTDNVPNAGHALMNKVVRSAKAACAEARGPNSALSNDNGLITSQEMSDVPGFFIPRWIMCYARLVLCLNLLSSKNRKNHGGFQRRRFGYFR